MVCVSALTLHKQRYEGLGVVKLRLAHPLLGALAHAENVFELTLFKGCDGGAGDHAAVVRRFKVTDAAAHDGAQLGAVLDPGNTASPVWADTAYRSAANIEMLQKRGLKPQFQRPKPRGKPMPWRFRRKPDGITEMMPDGFPI